MSPVAPPDANFDLIARPYRWLEYLTLGRTLERCRLHYLPALLHAKRALVLGDGDGRFLAQLLHQNPHLHADAIDTSAAMLHLLHRRCEQSSPTSTTRLNTHQISALHFTPTRQYDLIVTHFFLDCLTQPELEALIARIVSSLTPNALWLISDFRIPTGPMNLPARAFIRTLYLAFRLVTNLHTAHLPDHATPLSRAGLTKISHHHSLAGILTTELWQTTMTSHPAPANPLANPPETPQQDPLPSPEPAVPSLDEPDPGVFRHVPILPTKIDGNTLKYE
jgi:ubiquinone/menaquinone biosynthesis C-methylase UbiE